MPSAARYGTSALASLNRKPLWNCRRYVATGTTSGAPLATLRSAMIPASAATRGVGAPALERERQLAAPVRVLVDRARQVRLLEHLEHVLGLQHGELRRRARDERVRRARREVEPVALERRAELFLFGFAQRDLLLRVHGQTEPFPQLEIVRLPVAAPGRQVVRGDADQRLARIGLRRTEFADGSFSKSSGR